MEVIAVSNWAESTQGTPIALYKSKPTVTRPIVVIGGVHGDEPEGVALAEAVLAWLKRNTADEQIITHDWILIPCLNPDGYAANTRVNGNKVDLNRNYPSQDWSQSYDQERYFPGTRPGSEPEIQALTSLFKEVPPALVIHCHSWHPCIVYAGEGAKTAAETLATSSGYPLKSEIGYPTPGSLSRYGLEKGFPVICIEEAEKTPAEEIWPHFASGFSTIFADRHIFTNQTNQSNAGA